MKVSIRPFNEPTDAGFIFSTFPKGVYFAAFYSVSGLSHDAFFSTFYEYLKELILDSSISIATTKENPDFILGYAILHKTELEWVYVKEAFRRNRIATLLLKDKHIESVNEKNLTVLGHRIMQNHKDLFTKKEESNDTPETPQID